jgi:hypothetical protein
MHGSAPISAKSASAVALVVKEEEEEEEEEGLPQDPQLL